MEELKNKSFLLEENISNFFNSIPIPSYIWQKQNDNFILIDYNIAAEQITNGKIKDLIREKASEIHKERPDIVEAINESFQSKKSLETPDGQRDERGLLLEPFSPPLFTNLSFRFKREYIKGLRRLSGIE